MFTGRFWLLLGWWVALFVVVVNGYVLTSSCCVFCLLYSACVTIFGWLICCVWLLFFDVAVRCVGLLAVLMC